jgi:hypothetical protein
LTSSVFPVHWRGISGRSLFQPKVWTDLQGQPDFMLLKLFYIFLSRNGGWVQSLYYEVDGMVDKGSLILIMCCGPTLMPQVNMVCFCLCLIICVVIFQQTPLNFCTRSFSVVRKHIPGSDLWPYSYIYSALNERFQLFVGPWKYECVHVYPNFVAAVLQRV